jgi:tetratricopeptide (TPR) repeat protein
MTDTSTLAAVQTLLVRSISLVNQVDPGPQAFPSASEIEALYNAGIDALEEERFDAALEIFGHLTSWMPGHARYKFAFALCLQHFGEVQLAGEHYSLAYALDPSQADCAFRLGECLAVAGHIVEAQDALRAAIQLTELPGSNPDIRILAERLLDQLN